MVNISVFFYLVIPFLLSIISFYMFKRYVSGATFTQAIGSSIVGFFISVVLMFGAFYISRGMQTADTEIINGEVIDKTREHGHYLRSYECNCTTVTSCGGSGSGRSCSSQRVCQTCYEDRYTVTWECIANIGRVTIKHLDETSRSVYNTPDPKRYTDIVIGEPFAMENSYTNYIKAVPGSLFRPAQETLKQQYASKIPEYPGQVFDFYRINRTVPVGVNIPNIREWNDRISNALRVLGPKRQANVVVVVTNIADPNYFYALQDAWVNGRKNDIVLVIGAPEFPGKPAWVNVMALTQDSIFQIRLRDRIMSLDQLTAESVVNNIKEEALASFKRKEMEDFKYLEAEISPPTWVMVMLTILNIIAYGAFWFYMVTHLSSSTYNRYGVPRYDLNQFKKRVSINNFNFKHRR